MLSPEQRKKYGDRVQSWCREMFNYYVLGGEDRRMQYIPSIRRNPVIADVFAQLGYMERKGSGMGKIVNPIKALPYFVELMLPTFFSDRAQFTITFPNIITIWQQEHPEVQVNYVENDVPQGVPQGVPQDVPQEDNLDKWIEYQVAVFPNITTEELAAQAGVSSKTIKRRIAKMTHIQFVGSGYSGHWEVKPK